MSANATVATTAATTAKPAHNGERRHHTRLLCGYMLAIALIVGLAVYGSNYYALSFAERPFSPKHALLKPSGRVGVNRGFPGLAMFLGIFVYPLRKHWLWLSKQGSSRHWLDNHILLGLTAPFTIAFHASFKFRGFAGMAFWIMVAVSLSGMMGSYLDAQITRRLNLGEITSGFQ